MRLRLFHHRDGARVAYREAGAGPGLVLLHSALLSHREFEPVVEHLTHRFRLVLPDLPLHGDSEDRPRHPYTQEWFAEVMSAFCTETCGPRPLVGGHGLGAEILLRATATRRLHPGALVLMPNRLHRPAVDGRRRGAWRVATRAAGLPVLDRVLTHAAARAVFRPDFGMTLSARGNPAARDLFRHAFADVGGNATLAHAWSRFAAHWPAGAQRDLLDAYPRLDLPVLLLWADEDRMHPLSAAEEALDLLPDGQLRVLPGTGYLIAYDDPVGVARELVAFCG
jgi:pimeloyl-ACP methyl ester carboxylesterase